MFKDDYGNNHIYGPDLIKDESISRNQIIDVREPFEIKICNIPNTKNIPLNSLLMNAQTLLDKNQTYYILCHTGQRSYYVTDTLTKLGYSVINVVGGITSIDEFNVPY